MTLLEIGLLLADILIAAVGIIVAIVAVFGYALIRDTVKTTAKEEAQRVAEEEFRKFVEASNIKEMIAKAAIKEGDALYADLQQTTIEGEENVK